MCGQMPDDNRFELIEKYKKRLIEATNIDGSQDEMKVIDNILFRFWQMGWLDILNKSDKDYEQLNNALSKATQSNDYYREKNKILQDELSVLRPFYKKMKLYVNETTKELENEKQ